MRSGASTHDHRLGWTDDAIVAAFDRQARQSRDHILIRSTHGAATVGDIDDWSRAALNPVAAMHLEPGTIVGLSAPNGPAFLAGLLALRRARCSALLLDDMAPTVDRARAIDAIGARAVLHCRMQQAGTRMDARVESVTTTATGVTHPDWAVIKMTSGSTGAQRGVAITSEALLADEAALAATMGLRATDRLVATLPMSHRYGFTMLALPALVRGLPLLMPPDTGPLAPIMAATAAEATVFPTVPAYLQAVLRMAQPPPWPASVRLFITAGAPMPPATAAQFREVSGRAVHVFYGASECGGICYDREGDAAERGTVGTPVDGVSISLTGPDDPHGEGLITVQSPAIADTYVPAADGRLGSGRFQTADLGCWRSGELELRRRADRVINVRGFKVDPAEVEQILAALPGVDDVAVTGAPGPDGIGTLVRAVVACRTGTLDAAAVTAWCRGRLADHKVPRSVVVVTELPRNARGKIDHAALDHA